MKTIEFMRSNDPLFYYCNCTTFKKCIVDHSGTYILASEAQERERVLREALERLARPLACGCLPCTGDCRSQIALESELEGRIDYARAALEAKEE